MTKKGKGPLYYEQIELGFNYRMTDIQAVLGISQLDRIEEFIFKRHQIANFYNKELINLPLKLPKLNEDSYSRRDRIPW